MKRRITAFVMVLCLIVASITLTSCSSVEKNKSGIYSSADLVSKKIGVVEGSQSEDIARVFMSEDKNCVVKTYSNQSDMVAALNLDEIDCFITNEHFAKDLADIEEADYKYIEESLGEGTYDIVTSYDVFEKILAKTVADMKEDGTLDKIVNSYLEEGDFSYEYKQIDETKDALVVAFNPDDYPYSFNDENERSVGVMYALLTEICYRLDSSLQPLTVQTSSVQVAAAFKYADFALGTLASVEKDNPYKTESITLFTYDHVIVTK